MSCDNRNHEKPHLPNNRGEKLKWHFGPTKADPDSAKMWCYLCGGEVFGQREGYICLRCGASEEHEAETK
jgi:hypothetical protein